MAGKSKIWYIGTATHCNAGGVLSTKDPTGTCWKHGYQNQPLGIWMTPNNMQNLVFEWVDFSKFSLIWAKIGSKKKKIGKNRVILLKIWPKTELISIWMAWKIGICMGLLSNSVAQNWTNWYMNGLKNWYLYGSTFKFCGGTSLPKPNLNTPHPSCCNASMNRLLGGWHSHTFTTCGDFMY